MTAVSTRRHRHRDSKPENSEYPEVYDCEDEVDVENDDEVVYDEEYCQENEIALQDETKICRVFVDGNDADYEICDDEDSLLERVWLLSKPPKIPKRTCLVPARRVQVIKECLASSIHPVPNLCETMRERSAKKSRRRKTVDSDVQYEKVVKYDGDTRASCQETRPNFIPICAQVLSEIL